LLKCTSEHHTDYEDLAKAIAIFEELTAHIDNAKEVMMPWLLKKGGIFETITKQLFLILFCTGHRKLSGPRSHSGKA
jgi:hypothetical protein